MSGPNRQIIGIITIHPTIEPTNMKDAIRGPTIYPTPRSAGYTSIPISPLKDVNAAETSAGITFRPSTTNLNTAASPIPENTVEAFDPPSSPARSTSAHAVPSG